MIGTVEEPAWGVDLGAGAWARAGRLMGKESEAGSGSWEAGLGGGE